MQSVRMTHSPAVYRSDRGSSIMPVMRQIENRSILLLLLISLGVFATGASSPSPTLSDSEKQAGWKLLFDGSTTAGWRGLGIDGFPDNRWEIKDNCLHCKGGPGRTDDIITTRKYENFELRFQWMCPKPPGNSGVKYRVQEKKGDGFAFGPEYQIMDDPGVEGIHATGSLYECFAPKGKKLRGPKEFNDSRILVHGNHVEHWLNGVKVVEYDFGSEALKAAVAKSKFKGTNWGKEPLGYIALQDHHEEVFFKNLAIREIAGDR